MPPRPELPAQSPTEIASALEAFLADYPAAALLEDGKALFDMRTAKYTLSTEHNRCTLHLWSEDANLVRRITAVEPRKHVLKITTQRFGQTKPQLLELTADRDRRTPSTREAIRTKYLRVLERALLRAFPEQKPEAFRTAMDLEKSFGPAYARGIQTQGQKAWAVIGINETEQQATIDGILTLGILWLAYCRENAGGRRLFQGLRLIVPRGTASLTLSRLPWLSAATRWELYELDPKTEALTERDAGDHGNLHTHLQHAPSLTTARERFAESAARVLQLVPAERHPDIEQRIRSATELAFLLHGLEFARVRMQASVNSFNREQIVTFGTGANETPLTPDTEPTLRELVQQLFARRHPDGDRRDPLFRMQPERWLESSLRRDVAPLEAHDIKLQSDAVYAQVPAFAAADRGMLDLLTVTADGRLAVIELKVEEDLHLALQGLDYWIRVRHHHQQNPDNVTGLGEFQRHGYFGGIVLSNEPPRLFLVAPALRIHPATETILRHLSPRVDWTLIALDERWRKKVKSVWRKRHTDSPLHDTD
ncbi:hypothetical protein SAMN05421771_0475 [Granulicella pectinivorans]|uniref:DUF91 domain-containing protein n=1 Tax=Granulicella pectinivorans TaxID=474950 RepID=A0A1I6LA33_9BACT|nr:hypothetical protein [Granulicella pectinivorans]SFS00356.1 hypothetical protein SAMN05421771_0475 [Granulicella pectinivorans]